jgi:hypothetical protein
MRMTTSLYIAAFLIAAIGVAHSYLGERYILIRLFRRNDLPKLFGSSEFTVRTLRFAWHVTSVAWLGLAAVLLLLAHPPASSQAIGVTVGVTFLAHSAIAFGGSRGKHYSWIVFLAIGAITIYATRT